MKILVTGSSGFLGGAIRQYLISKGYDTYGTTRSRPPKDEKEFHFDITKDSCEETFKGNQFDIIIHTIGLTDDRVAYRLLKQANVQGTIKILEYAKTFDCNHFIFLSSVSVYGLKTLGQNRTEDSAKIRPHSYINKYGMTKAAAELEVVNSEVPYTVLRLPLMIGKGDKMVSPKLIEVLENEQLFYLGDGNKLVSVMPVKNLCVLTSVLVKKGAFNQSFHAPSFHISLNSFVEEHSKITKLPFNIQKGTILKYRNNLPNIRKILMFYSWKGAHFLDAKIRSKIPEYEDIVSWQKSISYIAT